MNWTPWWPCLAIFSNCRLFHFTPDLKRHCLMAFCALGIPGSIRLHSPRVDQLQRMVGKGMGASATAAHRTGA